LPMDGIHFAQSVSLNVNSKIGNCNWGA